MHGGRWWTGSRPRVWTTLLLGMWWVSGPPARPSAPRGSQLLRAGGPGPVLLSFVSTASLCWAKTLTLVGMSHLPPDQASLPLKSPIQRVLITLSK